MLYILVVLFSNLLHGHKLSFTKIYKVKSIYLSCFTRDILTLLRTPFSASFDLPQNIANATDVMLQCISIIFNNPPCLKPKERS